MVGINIILVNELNVHYAVIDDLIVWYGGINILGRKDDRENLMRIESNDITNELLLLNKEIN